MIRIPPALRHEWRRERDWLAELPRLVSSCAEQWGLALEEPFDTPHSLVVPAGDVVLKVNAPSHFEADQEPDALASWSGRGAVNLVARDDARRAFVMERCRPGTRLREIATDHLAVVGTLLPRLWIDPGQQHPFRLIADEAARWADDVPRYWKLGNRPFERSLLSYAIDVFRTVDPTPRFLVNQDLHDRNVLRAEREPWLVIDPKPAVGEREVTAVGLLRNAAWDGGGAAVRRWLGVLEDLGLDGARARGWGVAHTLAWGRDADGRWSTRAVAAARVILAA